MVLRFAAILPWRKTRRLAAVFFILNSIVYSPFLLAEPVVINGAMLPSLVGTPIPSLRVIGERGEVIPFQIDEIASSGEYVCPQGESPNAGDGRFAKQDEIVFRWEDADDFSSDAGEALDGTIFVSRGALRRRVRVVEDSSLKLSTVSYLSYDHAAQLLQTPFYYARFARDRFHFTAAGIMERDQSAYFDLTNELRIEIVLRTLFGLLPIRYSEESMICFVTRYKAGPIRVIRRGDFHLSLGLGFKGSRAVVYQMCYPEMVKVPVTVSLPVRFSRLFTEAYIEMTPVIRSGASAFRFSVPQAGFSRLLGEGAPIDTLLPMVPSAGFFVGDGAKGFGWMTSIAAADSMLRGSGYLFRRPSRRVGCADCGIRIAVRDLPSGRHEIVNWVLFSDKAPELGFDMVRDPLIISAGTFSRVNLLLETVRPHR